MYFFVRPVVLVVFLLQWQKSVCLIVSPAVLTHALLDNSGIFRDVAENENGRATKPAKAKSKVQEQFQQEQAKILYSNPKYVSDMAMITTRRSRGSPYLSHFNGTNLQPWGNNITLSILMHERNGEDIKLDFKLCEGLKWIWIADWVRLYSDVPVSSCPIPTSTYHFHDVPLPPKNLPIKLPSGDYYGKMVIYITRTKERVSEIGVRLRVSSH